MRTTITLDSDVEALVRTMMAERGLSFKEAVNTALRSALAKRSQENFRTRTFSMGAPAVPLDQALRLAADLEDAEIQRKLSVGK
ncbi:antitoxin [Amycolatopsis pithecellobii]|uniref:Antitoxin n=1 Tax=Amycolatopsis pithecellobii TaxID=664692 RepID=A0A6N7YWP7_9PSEU|nr:antitoxin [Amycolatopsis pithecellobii]MTD57517.1 antitoxin [Amycolatopsis pithecellobii]